MTDQATTPSDPGQSGPSALNAGVWELDPDDSSVGFHVRHFYGLMTVKGRFDSYEGTIDLSRSPAIQLTIQADSLDTKNKKRDEHLRSADFFGVEKTPEVRFVSDNATLEDEALKVSGQLAAGGKQVPLAFDARIRGAGDDLSVHTEVEVDHRDLGMTWSPLGILRAPSKLVVRGRLKRI
jgi:polyisoprenoid-binding protein YceI